MRKLFNITEPYKFEYNDLRALITVANVILIMFFGLSIAWLGLVIGAIGLVKDLTIDKRINGAVMHLSNIALNLFFIIAY